MLPSRVSAHPRRSPWLMSLPKPDVREIPMLRLLATISDPEPRPGYSVSEIVQNLLAWARDRWLTGAGRPCVL